MHHSTVNTTPLFPKSLKELQAELAKKEGVFAEAFENQEELKRRFEELKALLRDEVSAVVKKALTIEGQSAPVDASMSDPEAVQVVQYHLITAPAVLLPRLVCDALNGFFGFADSLITYGEFKGTPCGFIPGLPLLKFVGFVDPAAPTLEEAALLMSLDESDTKH